MFPSRLLSTICALVLMMCLVNAQTTFFSDDFSGNTIDTNKWSIAAFGSGSVTQSNGLAFFNHPFAGSKANLTTVPQFDQPIAVTGTFTIFSDAPAFNITTRSSGAMAGYGDPAGLGYTFYYNSNPTEKNFFIYMLTGAMWYTEVASAIVPVASGTSNSFEIVDSLSSVSVSLNGTHIGSWLADSNFSVGHSVSVTDFGNLDGGATSSSSMGPIVIEVVPEPSTYALLLLSGAASLWALKRRKS